MDEKGQCVPSGTGTLVEDASQVSLRGSDTHDAKWERVSAGGWFRPQSVAFREGVSIHGSLGQRHRGDGLRP